jgi:Glyoxalase-like domain
MAYDFQVVVDCARPHELADWWAETLGWEVPRSDEAFIRRMIAEGQAPESATTTHRGQLVWVSGAAIRHPDGPGSGRPRVLFLQVPEGKTVKNRLHLDVWTGDDKAEDVVARLAGRGATELYRGQEGPSEWVTMADPEGNEFCVL